MNKLTPSEKIIIYLSSTRNLVGVMLALIGVGAYLLNFLGAFWFPLCIGLYFIGVLIIPPDPREGMRLPEQPSAEQLRKSLDKYVKSLRGKLPDEAMQHVVKIKGTIMTALPRIEELQKRGDPNAYLIRQTILDYLPETVSTYLKLPRQYATQHVLENGKTPKDILIEQLTILDSSTTKIVADLSKGDTQALMANGQFLKDKFEQHEWEL